MITKELIWVPAPNYPSRKNLSKLTILNSLLQELQSGQDYQIAFFSILDQLEDSILEVTPLTSFFF